MADDLTDEVSARPFRTARSSRWESFYRSSWIKTGGLALPRPRRRVGYLDGRRHLVAQIDWEKGQADEGTSWARLPDITGDFQTVDTPTPGAPNEIPTAIAEQTSGVPEAFRLHGNWPNPFNASTTIAFDVERTVPVHLVVYDVLGRRVRACTVGNC